MSSSDLPSQLAGTDFLAVAESSPDFVALAWLDNRLAYLNPAGRRMVGLGSLEEALSHPLTAFLSEEGLRTSMAIRQAAVLEHGFWQGRSALRHFVTGREIPVEATGFLVRDPETGEPRLLATFQRDISERLLLEQRLRQAEKLEAVGRLAGGIAHDFNNILTIVLGYADVAAAGAGATVQEAMAELSLAAQQGAQITKQLLALARRDVVRPVLLDLNAVVTELLPMLRTLAGETVRVTTAPGADIGVVRADRTQVGQVLLNLCGNAKDAMPPEGGSIVLATRASGDRVELVVRDDGTGIAPADLPRVREPFFTTKAAGGTGLGLATVAAIVEAAGGSLEIESEPGSGTTVTIALPRAAAAAATTEGSAEGAGEHRQRGTETVLLVEDDDAIRSILSAVLAANGYSVLTASDGEQAAAALGGEETIHLVVTDMVMPRSSGATVAERVRERDPALPVILISGNTQTDASRAVAEGPYEFLPKPFPPSDLLRLVRRVLDARP